MCACVSLVNCVCVRACVWWYMCMLQVRHRLLAPVQAHISFFLAPRLFANNDPTSQILWRGPSIRACVKKPHTSEVGPGGHGPNALAPIVPVTWPGPGAPPFSAPLAQIMSGRAILDRLSSEYVYDIWFFKSPSVWVGVTLKKKVARPTCSVLEQVEQTGVPTLSPSFPLSVTKFESTLFHLFHHDLFYLVTTEYHLFRDWRMSNH